MTPESQTISLRLAMAAALDPSYKRCHPDRAWLPEDIGRLCGKGQHADLCETYCVGRMAYRLLEKEMVIPVPHTQAFLNLIAAVKVFLLVWDRTPTTEDQTLMLSPKVQRIRESLREVAP